jgi:chromosome segregation ATPase
MTGPVLRTVMSDLLTNMTKKLAEKNAEIERLQDEVKEVHVNNLILAKENREQEAEIERLTEKLKEGQGPIISWLTDEMNKVKPLEAEIEQLRAALEALEGGDDVLQ